jgi:DNA-binding transcriptional LysR family regulator
LYQNITILQEKCLSIKYLRDVDLVVPPEPSDLRNNIFQLCQEYDFSPKVSVEAFDRELMTHFISLGFGAAVINRSYKLQKALVGIPIKEMHSIKYYLLHRKHQYFFSDLKLFKNIIIQEVSKEEIF